MPSILERRSTAVFIFFIAVWYSVGARGQCSNSQRPKSPVTVTDKDNGSKVALAKGATLIVKLEARLGTGFGWRIAKNDASKLKPEGEPVTEKPDQDMLDGIEYQVFRFKAVAPGTVALGLHYSRPWEKDVPPSKTFDINAEIH